MIQERFPRVFYRSGGNVDATIPYQAVICSLLRPCILSRLIHLGLKLLFLRLKVLRSSAVMVSIQSSALAAAILAAIYQFFLKDFFLITFGIGRVVEPLENFPYKCKNLRHGQLEGCGDMWLDERTRVLYAACAGVQGRREWNPRYAFQL
jgi:hypothetical protein